MAISITRRGLTLSAVAGTALAGAAGLASRAAATGEGGFGIDLAAMDRSVVPGDDFYRYVNGTWLKTSQIPADRSSLAEFGRLDELNTERGRAILEAAASAPTTPEAKTLGDFYASLMDEAAAEAKGTKPLAPQLARIAAIDSPADLARGIAEVSRGWLAPLPGGGSPVPPSPIATGVTVDLKNPTRYLPAIGQGGIGLPDRDYFLLEGPSFAKAREAYKTHLAAMFNLAGFSEPGARSARVYALEERIANSHWTRQAQRNVEKRYNIWSRADLAAKAPGLDWDAFLTAAGFAGQDTFLVSQPSTTIGAAEAAGAVPLQDWKDYLAFRAIHAFAPYGPKAFVEENFAFNDRALAGTPVLAARWKRAGQTMDRAMGSAVGRIYLEKHFQPEARAQAQVMTGNIKAAMGRRIAGLAWMTPATKARALTKLAAARVDVGGQQPLRTYDGLQVRRGEAFGNVMRAAHHDYERNLAKLGRPVDRGEWQLVPQTVNAQANPILVKIMFPAGIMQGVFFDPKADPAVNYGAIGVVMGHELSHLFDDQGSKFDEHGALNNWWTPDDLKQFTVAVEALAAQYSAYEPLPGAHLNGHLTLGENIADLAGLSLARDAYYASLNDAPAPVIDGFSADQRFYMAFNQVYRSLYREDALRQSLSTNPHSPGEWRGAEVRNVDPWYAAFDVKPGQRMYLPPEKRVRIW
jgi:putative endopeptidase